MLIKNPNKVKLQSYFAGVNKYLEMKEIYDIDYIDLGCKVVRSIYLSGEFFAPVEKQLSFCLKRKERKYDATIIVWKEEDFENLPAKISPDFTPRENLRLRIELLASQKKEYQLSIIDEEYSKHNPILDIDPFRGFVNAVDTNTNTYYYGVRNLEPEEFIKEGHIFVQMFNKIVKTETSNLVHGAVVGMNNQGILFCARGQRGKSTLAVLAMMKGFEYVSDDYLVLEKGGDKLYSHPIYSIITLSPRMYNELYDELKGTQFVSNNARKDKYVINIDNFHSQFRKCYPINICMFPEITNDPEPSITKCTVQEKGRAITHLIHSTIIQTQDRHDIKTVKKLISFVKDFEFYKINLCQNIYKNVEYLKDFMKKEIKNDELCIK